jgi:hypothetical protein
MNLIILIGHFMNIKSVNGEVIKLDNMTNAKLTSAEVAALWTQYVNEIASIS